MNATPHLFQSALRNLYTSDAKKPDLPRQVSLAQPDRRAPALKKAEPDETPLSYAAIGFVWQKYTFCAALSLP
jgi:hypothetical protein